MLTLDTPHLTIVWNRHKEPVSIPSVVEQSITMVIQTSADRESLIQFLNETLSGVLSDIAIETKADEKLISIN